MAGDGTGVEQAARENERERKREEMAMPYQKLPHRETSTKKLSSVPLRKRGKEGGRSCGERHNAIDRTTSSELLQFTVFPAFFRVIPTSFVVRSGWWFGEGQEGKCARHVAAETFVIRDGASEGRVFAARRMPRGWALPSNALTHVRRSGCFRS